MDKVPYLLKRGVFSDEELRLIFNELYFLKSTMEGPEWTDAARNEDKKIIKKNQGIFLRHIYTDMLKFSSIAKLCQDRVSRDLKEYSDLDITNRSSLYSNECWVLVSHYEKGDHYLPHQDATNVTALFWFNKKEFTGGDLTFTDTNEVVEYENNSMIIFPSWAKHGVSKVSDEGRYCVTVGLHINPHSQ